MSNSIDILFINPPYERLKGFSSSTIHNGLLGLATYINSQGFKTLVYDVDVSANEGLLTYNNKNRATSHEEYVRRLNDDDFFIWDEVRHTIESANPRFVGITLMTPSLHSAIKIAGIAKKLDKVVLVGGPHVNILKKKILESTFFDFAFFGEAEFSVSEFLKLYAESDNLLNLKGIGFRNGHDVLYNGFSDRITDLNKLPFPDRALLLYQERYLKSGLATIMASRGCPFNCAFCASVPIWGRNTFFRSNHHIIEEIKYLHATYNMREFRFFDDTFTAKRENTISFCKHLIDTFGENYFSWWCLTRVNAIDEEVLLLLKRAGCDQIHLGVESGSDRVLKLMHKGITTKQVEKAVSLARMHKFWVGTFFMIGIPYETLEDMRMTIEFIKKINPDSVNLCTFTPYPGTELYDYCIDQNLIVHDDSYEIFKFIGHHSMSNHFLDKVSVEEYREVLKEILELTTRISNSMTFSKFLYRLKVLTPEKIVNKLKLKFKAFYQRIIKNLP